MGTRAIIKILDCKNKPICAIYTQFDGYPSGVMYDIAQYFSQKRLVNGYSSDFIDVNGPEDLASQVVTLLKLITTVNRLRVKSKLRSPIGDAPRPYIACGTIYLVPPDEADKIDCVEYKYEIYPDPKYCRACGDPWNTECREGNFTFRIRAYDPNGYLMFDVTPKEYLERFKEE